MITFMEKNSKLLDTPPPINGQKYLVTSRQLRRGLAVGALSKHSKVTPPFIVRSGK